MKCDEKLRHAAQQLNRALSVEAVPDRPARPRFRGVAVLVAAALVVLLGLAFLVGQGNRDGTELATGSGPRTARNLSLGIDHLWPRAARHKTSVDVAGAFAQEVLGWDGAGASVVREEDSFGPVWVRLVRPGNVEVVDVLTVPTDAGQRVITEVGVAWATGAPVEEPEAGQGGSTIGLIRVATAVQAQLTLRLDDGTQQTLVATNVDIEAGRVHAANIASPGAVRSILILYLDSSSDVIAATGASFPKKSSGDVESPAEAFACPITIPTGGGFVPPPPWDASPSDPSQIWYGSADLWTPLAKVGHGPRKSVWWSANFPGGQEEEEPELEVVYQRLDKDLPPVVHSAPGTNAATTEDGWFMINGIEPDEPGCWQATASYKGATLSYVYEVK